jgi:hypothetical protein
MSQGKTTLICKGQLMIDQEHRGMPEDYDVFLSYSLKDRDWVIGLIKALSQRIFRVWSDMEAIRPGDSLILSIDEGIRNSKSIIPVITPESVRSSFQAAEIGSALALKKMLIPIVLKDTPSSLCATN